MFWMMMKMIVDWKHNLLDFQCVASWDFHKLTRTIENIFTCLQFFFNRLKSKSHFQPEQRSRDSWGQWKWRSEWGRRRHKDMASLAPRESRHLRCRPMSRIATCWSAIFWQTGPLRSTVRKPFSYWSLRWLSKNISRRIKIKETKSMGSSETGDIPLNGPYQ